MPNKQSAAKSSEGLFHFSRKVGFILFAQGMSQLQTLLTSLCYNLTETLPYKSNCMACQQTAATAIWPVHSCAFSATNSSATIFFQIH